MPEHDRQQLVVAERRRAERAPAFRAADRAARPSSSYTIPCYTSRPRCPVRAVMLCADRAARVLLSAGCSDLHRKKSTGPGARSTPRAPPAPSSYAPRSFTAATTALQQAHDAVAQRDYRLALTRAARRQRPGAGGGPAGGRRQGPGAQRGRKASASRNAALLQLDARLKAADAAQVPARSSRRARAAAKARGNGPAKSSRDADRRELRGGDRGSQGAPAANSLANRRGRTGMASGPAPRAAASGAQRPRAARPSAQELHSVRQHR